MVCCNSSFINLSLKSNSAIFLWRSLRCIASASFKRRSFDSTSNKAFRNRLSKTSYSLREDSNESNLSFSMLHTRSSMARMVFASFCRSVSWNLNSCSCRQFSQSRRFFSSVISNSYSFVSFWWSCSSLCFNSASLPCSCFWRGVIVCLAFVCGSFVFDSIGAAPNWHDVAIHHRVAPTPRRHDQSQPVV